MFLKIRDSAFMSIWLSLFPTKKHGELKPPLKALETPDVPPVPPFPQLIFTDTFWMYGESGEAA